MKNYIFSIPFIMFLVSNIVFTSGCSSFDTTSSEYVVVPDSIQVSFEDSKDHTMMLHKGDIVVVDSEYDSNTYRVHIGDYHVIVSKNSLTKRYQSESVSSGGGQTIQTGPRGGKYYINSNGNKTYIKSKK
jgi:hypothetical protein